ncbi:MAG: hypothetical protein ACFFDN_01905 [Candidatus Hodarchaeota archaeon]
MTINNEERSGIGYLIGFIFIISIILNGAITAIITVVGRTPEYRYIGIFNIGCILIELVLVFFGSRKDNNKLIYTGIILGLIAQIIIIPSLIIKLDYVISQIKLTNFMIIYIIFTIDIEFDLNIEMNLVAIIQLFNLNMQSIQRMASNRISGVGTNIVVAIIGMIINLIGIFNRKIWKHIRYILERNFSTRRGESIHIEWESVPAPESPDMLMKRPPPISHTPNDLKPPINEIDLSEEHVEEISSIKCPKCKKLTPSDSNFCIFCGFQIQ